MTAGAKIILSGDDRTQAAFKSASDGLKSVESAASSLKGALGALGVGLSAGAFVGFIKSGIDAADSINKLSQRTGIATEALSELQYAFKLGDVGVEDLNTGIKKLNVSIAQGLAGDKEKTAMFRQLGIQLVDMTGKAKSTEQVLLEMSDAFASAKDGAGKTAIAVGLLGKAGDSMIPAMNGGAQAIRSVMQEANKLGLSIGPEFARRAEEFNDNLARVKASTNALAIGLGGQVVESWGKVAKAMAEAAVQGGILDALIAGWKTRWFGDKEHQANVMLVEAVDFLGVAERNLEIARENNNKNDIARYTGEIKRLKESIELRRLELGLTSNQSSAETARLARGNTPQGFATLALPGAGSNQAETIDESRRALAQYVESLQKAIEKEQELGETQKAINQLNAMGKLGEIPQVREMVMALAEQVEKSKHLKDSLEAEAKAREAIAKAMATNQAEAAKAVALVDQNIESLVQGNEQLRQEIELIGLEGYARAAKVAAIEAEQIAKLELALIDAKSRDAGTDMIAALERELELRRQRAKLMNEAAGKNIDADLAKASADAAKKAQEEWERGSEKIRDSITDALMRGFEGGKDAGKNFQDTLVNMFKTMVLRPQIEFMVSEGQQALRNVFGQVSGGGAGGMGGNIFGGMTMSGRIDEWGATHLGMANRPANFVGPLGPGETRGLTASGALGSAGMGFAAGQMIQGATGSKGMGAVGGAVSGAMLGYQVGGYYGAIIGGIAGLFGGMSGGGEGKVINHNASSTVDRFGTVRAMAGGNGSDGSQVSNARQLAESYGAVAQAMRSAGLGNVSGARFYTDITQGTMAQVGARSLRNGPGDIEGLLLRAIKAAAGQSTGGNRDIATALAMMNSSSDLKNIEAIIAFARTFRLDTARMNAARDPLQAQRADLRLSAFERADAMRQRAVDYRRQAVESGLSTGQEAVAALRQQALADLGLKGTSKELEGFALRLQESRENISAMRSVLDELGYTVERRNELILQAMDRAKHDLRVEFMGDIREQLLAIRNPAQAAREALEKENAARLANAAAVGATAAQMVQLTELYTLQSKAIDAQAMIEGRGWRTDLTARLWRTQGRNEAADLLSFDFAADLAKLQAQAAGKGAADILLLERTLAAERLQIIEDYAQQALDAQKTAGQNLIDWLRGQQFGDNSSLSPQAKLDAAMANFNALRLGAAGGDADSLANITGAADAVLQLAREMFASGAQYATTEANIRTSIQNLIPHAAGGAFTNGIFTSPTMFPAHVMGEAGSEAVMPLANINGSLGVRVAGGDRELVREVKRLQDLTAKQTSLIEALLRNQAAIGVQSLAKEERIAAGVEQAAQTSALQASRPAP